MADDQDQDQDQGLDLLPWVREPYRRSAFLAPSLNYLGSHVVDTAFHPDLGLQRQITQNQQPAPELSPQMQQAQQEVKGLSTPIAYPTRAPVSTKQRILAGIFGGLAGVGHYEIGKDVAGEITGKNEFERQKKEWQVRESLRQGQYKDALQNMRELEQIEQQNRMFGLESAYKGVEAEKNRAQIARWQDQMLHPEHYRNQPREPAPSVRNVSAPGQAPQIMQYDPVAHKWGPAPGMPEGAVETTGAPPAPPKQETNEAVGILENMARQKGLLDQYGRGDWRLLPDDTIYNVFHKAKQSQQTDESRMRAQLDVQKYALSRERFDFFKNLNTLDDYTKEAIKQNGQIIYDLNPNLKKQAISWMQSEGIKPETKMDTYETRIMDNGIKVGNYVKSVREALNNPLIVKNIGAWKGRVNQLLLKAGIGPTEQDPEKLRKAIDAAITGTPIPGSNDEEKREFTKFVGDLKFIYASDLGTLASGRVTRAIFDAFSDVEAKPEQGMPVLQGRLDTVVENAKQSIAAIKGRATGDLGPKAEAPKPEPPKKKSDEDVLKGLK
jgi:hypothetical protein